MAITTYDELKTALADWSLRTDLTAYMDDFIDQSESFFRYPPLRVTDPGIGGIRANITKATGSLSTSAASIARPSDFLEAYRFDLTADNGGLVEWVDPEQMKLKWRSGSGKPRYWTVTDVVELDVVPDSAYAYELSYYADFADLDDTDTTNWVLTNYPNAYLSCCMFHLSRFIKDDAQADSWMVQYKAAAAAINKAYQRSRVSQGAIAAKVG